MRKAALIYSSITGNTLEVVKRLETYLSRDLLLEVISIEEFKLATITNYDLIIVGTYSWGDGEIPLEMEPLYEAFENEDTKHIKTAVFGTGDSFYPHFCGAVNEFRDMLYVQTTLLATLKIELSPQPSDEERIRKFATILLEKCYT